MRLFVLIPAFFVLLMPSSAFSGNPLKEGVGLLVEGAFDEAAERLLSAKNDYPEVADFIEIYLARAYLGAGKPKDAAEALDGFQRRHPGSPLFGKALALEADALIASGEEKALKFLESYLKDHPNDHERTYTLGLMLKKRGDEEKAKEAFKKVYASSEEVSAEAMKHLSESDIGPPELLLRAEKLISAFRYSEAEACLGEALKKNPGRLSEDIRKTLGKSLFRQKRYREAAEAFSSAFDTYNEARSLYRAGDEAGLKKALDTLTKMQDKRASSLLIASAVEKRRKGNPGEALKLLAEIKKKYPLHKEDALWHIGWTHYLEGNFSQALPVFTELYNTHGGSKYHYWMARAFERTGGEASHLYGEIKGKGDFYDFLSRPRSKDALPASETPGGGEPAKNDFEPGIFKRAEILFEAGLEGDAAEELSHMANISQKPSHLIAISYKLKDIGRYKEAIGVITRLPEALQAKEVLYPLAYRPLVSEAASKYRISPNILLSVMREESRFDPLAFSPAGAMGLMQLMPATAEDASKGTGIDLSDKNRLYDAGTNISLGARHLESLMEKFGSLHTALAAYNAGAENVLRWLGMRKYDSLDEFIEDIPYPETQKYLKRILTTLMHYEKYGSM